MSTPWESDTTTVGCVRIRTRGGDPQHARQKIGRLLGNAELRPSRLPLSSVLCLRNLQLPAPGTQWNHERVHPPREWEESATQELDRLAAQAARPALAPVPPSAQAVLFLDRAELLACLTADWLLGTLRTNWWWFTLLKRIDADSMVLREWMRSPELVPVAIASLASHKLLTEFLQKLPDDVAGDLLENVRRAFAVPSVSRAAVLEFQSELDTRVAQSKSSPASEMERSPLERLESSSEQSPGHSLVEMAPAFSKKRAEIRRPSRVEPWLPIVPEASAPSLSIRKRVLIAQALMLHRAPAGVRTVAFQQELAEWQTWAEAQPDLSSPLEAVPVGAVPRETPKPAPSGTVRLISPKPTGTSHAEAAAFSAIEPLPTARIEFESDVSSTPELTTQPVSLASVESSFAGVMFLLNVALYLKLYADFASRRTQGLELNIWDFLCLLGSEFAGKEMEEDGLCGLLATLAGRSKLDPPGADFKPPTEWILPESWLDPFPELFERREIIRDGRVQVLHPAGFVISDKAVEGGCDDLFSRWVSWMSGYIRARLARAIGRDDAAEMLCRIPGRVTCTSTRVDVFYSLESYPIEIRLAGLDRDPGWIPAAGHYVAYHFQ
jgi:hypothetical protein